MKKKKKLYSHKHSIIVFNNSELQNIRWKARINIDIAEPLTINLGGTEIHQAKNFTKTDSNYGSIYQQINNNKVPTTLIKGSYFNSEKTRNRTTKLDIYESIDVMFKN